MHKQEWDSIGFYKGNKPVFNIDHVSSIPLHAILLNLYNNDTELILSSTTWWKKRFKEDNQI